MAGADKLGNLSIMDSDASGSGFHGLFSSLVIVVVLSWCSIFNRCGVVVTLAEGVS